MLLGRRPRPFSHPDWLFEIKWDGFRSLLRVDDGVCKLISRNGNEFKSFPALNAALPAALNARSVVLDGEIVCLAEDGKPQFRDLLFRRGEPRFVAFDLLWCDGEDLRYLPLIERKQRLRSVVRGSGERLLYCDHVEHDGEGLFGLACENDLEGIVAKRKSDPYLQGHATWVKIRNRDYSQWVGREKLFERERARDPDVGRLWASCAMACSSSTLHPAESRE
jgi:bifunctional non-homologous end joining protein LigD